MMLAFGVCFVFISWGTSCNEESPLLTCALCCQIAPLALQFTPWSHIKLPAILVGSR